MARSLIAGMLAAGSDPRSIRIAEPVATLRDGLHRDFDIDTFADNAEAVRGAAVWVLAVKPQDLRPICEALCSCAQTERPLVISIAAGITTRQLDRWLGGGLAIVRAMPNAPSLLGAGVSGLYANPQTGAADCLRAERLLSRAGAIVWLTDESKMDAVTAVSGSGPAYLFLLAESLLGAARTQGLPDDAARTLVLQTILGAARMLTEESEPPAELRRRVTSPGGTTQAAVEVLQAAGFEHRIADAVEAATQRSRQLSLAND